MLVRFGIADRFRRACQRHPVSDIVYRTSVDCLSRFLANLTDACLCSTIHLALYNREPLVEFSLRLSGVLLDELQG
jgi:hypothetical protein